MINSSAPGNHQRPLLADRAGAATANVVSGAIRLAARRWRLILAYQVLCFIALLFTLNVMDSSTEEEAPLMKRTWGGFDERPMTEKCYKQERVAMLLALFVGVFGVDQWYAHHWALAVFKMLTLGGFGIWATVDLVLWIVGGVYGTPGCPGGAGGGRGWAY